MPDIDEIEFDDPETAEIADDLLPDDDEEFDAPPPPAAETPVEPVAS